MNSRFLKPALVGGVVIGVLSALPLFAWGNACCCLWVLLGGATAAYLLQQNQPQPVTAGDGALVGLIAGGVGVAVYLVVSVPVSILVSPLERALVERLSQIDPEFRTAMDGAAGASLRLLGGFILMMFVSPVFGTLGGLVGAMAFRKPPLPGPPDPPARPSEPDGPIDVPFSQG